jgi:hypothetical protein
MVDFRVVLELEIAIRCGGGQLGVTRGGRDEADIRVVEWDGLGAAVGEDEPDEWGPAEGKETAEDGGVGGHAAPALAREGGAEE